MIFNIREADCKMKQSTEASFDMGASLLFRAVEELDTVKGEPGDRGPNMEEVSIDTVRDMIPLL